MRGPAREAYGSSKFSSERQLLMNSAVCRVNVIRSAALCGDNPDDSPGRSSRWRNVLRSLGRVLPLLPRSGYRSFVSRHDLVSAVELVASAPDCDRQVFIMAEPSYYGLAAIVYAASDRHVTSSGCLTRCLLGPLKSLRSMTFIRRLLELEQSEPYSSARLRSVLSWRAEHNYGQFLRGLL